MSRSARSWVSKLNAPCSWELQEVDGTVFLTLRHRDAGVTVELSTFAEAMLLANALKGAAGRMDDA